MPFAEGQSILRHHRYDEWRDGFSRHPGGTKKRSQTGRGVYGSGSARIAESAGLRPDGYTGEPVEGRGGSAAVSAASSGGPILGGPASGSRGMRSDRAQFPGGVRVEEFAGSKCPN